MRPLRRKDRALAESEAWALLESATFGVLSTTDDNGQPYGVPLHFCLIGRTLCFHCATEGHKLDNLERHPRVSFCVVGDVRVRPEQFTTDYESVIAFGKAKELFGEEKRAALVALVEKYAPAFADQGATYIESHGPATRVFGIRIERLTGKARRE